MVKEDREERILSLSGGESHTADKYDDDNDDNFMCNANDHDAIFRMITQRFQNPEISMQLGKVLSLF